MAFCITLSTAATKTAYQRFGDAFITALGGAMPELDTEQCRSILSEVISTVGRKAPKAKAQKKSPKKAAKAASPTKRDLKKVELIGELKSYGEHAAEIPDPSSTTIGAIRKLIAAAKRDKKAAEKAAKEAKKSPKKAKKSPKKAAAAEPSKRDLKKVELSKEVLALGGSLEKEATEYSITELRAMIKALTPKKKKGRKPKKTEEEVGHQELLATLADSLKSAEAETKQAENIVTEWEDDCCVASVTTFTGGQNGEVVATTSKLTKPAIEEAKTEPVAFEEEDAASSSESDLSSESDSDDESSDDEEQ